MGKTIKSLKGLVFSTPVPAPRPIPDPRPVPAPRPIVFELTKRAGKNVVRQFSYKVEDEEQDVSSFLDRARDAALKIVRENKNKKVNFVLTCVMSRLSIVTGEETTINIPFACKYRIVLEATDLGELYDIAKERILETISNFSSNGSNWRVSNILKMDISMINYNPLSASSWIELDKFLAKKKAVINMENEDNECFKWCITRALNIKSKNNERIDKELIEKSKELNWEVIEFPFKLNQIEKFEKNNPDISVTVFRFKDKKPIPMNELKNYGRKHHIDLLLISNEMTSHYCLIKDFSRLMTSSKSNHHGKQYYFRNCLRGYISKKALSKHWPYCKEHKCVRVELPEEDIFMRFTNIERSMRVPFVGMPILKVSSNLSLRAVLMKRSLLPKNIKSTFRARSVIISNALMVHYIKESWLRILRQAKKMMSLVNL